MKIAICDDDNGACEELRKILENISTEKDMIHIYNAGEELLGDISNGYIYDVVYLDIELPGLNGVEVGQVLREQVEKQHLDLIFISQKSSYCEQLFDLEPRRFYRKPFDKERIIKDLEERVYFGNIDCGTYGTQTECLVRRKWAGISLIFGRRFVYGSIE